MSANAADNMSILVEGGEFHEVLLFYPERHRFAMPEL
jgi:hypothetical protein